MKCYGAPNIFVATGAYTEYEHMDVLFTVVGQHGNICFGFSVLSGGLGRVGVGVQGGYGGEYRRTIIEISPHSQMGWTHKG